jgi:hypothetical protein
MYMVGGIHSSNSKYANLFTTKKCTQKVSKGHTWDGTKCLTIWRFKANWSTFDHYLEKKAL